MSVCCSCPFLCEYVCVFVCVCVSLSASALVACITVNGSPWPPHRNASWVSSLRRATVPNECTSVICKSLSPFATFDIPIAAWGRGGATISFAPAHLTLCSCQNEFKLSHDDKSCAAKGTFDHSQYAQPVPSWNNIIKARRFAYVGRHDAKY